jgi:hypothetical protein
MADEDHSGALAEHFFGKHRRFFYANGLCEEIQRDIDRILKLARTQSGSGRLKGVYNREPAAGVESQIIATRRPGAG